MTLNVSLSIEVESIILLFSIIIIFYFTEEKVKKKSQMILKKHTWLAALCHANLFLKECCKNHILGIFGE